LQGHRIEGQFHNYELANVTVSPETEFQVDKIVLTRNKHRIKHSCQLKG